MPTKSEWHNGPPPSLGWWPASRSRNAGWYRWWDGQNWSICMDRYTSKAEIRRLLDLGHASKSTDIEWKDRPKNWPARSRT